MKLDEFDFFVEFSKVNSKTNQICVSLFFFLTVCVDAGEPVSSIDNI